MPLEFNCQYCNSRLRVPENTAGRRARCPACGAEQTIPDGGASGLAPAARASNTPHASSSQFAPPLHTETEYAIPPLEDPLASPYQAPRAPDIRPQSPLVPPASRVAAEERIRAPAIAMIVLSSVCLVLLGLGLILFFALFAVAEAPRNDGGAVFIPLAFELIMYILSCSIALLMLIGGINMLKLRNRGLAMAGAILGMIPVISPCCLLGIPFGIWSISVMNDPEVQRAFR